MPRPNVQSWWRVGMIAAALSSIAALPPISPQRGLRFALDVEVGAAKVASISRRK